MKKVISIIGIICLSSIIILNLLFTAVLDNSEKSIISNNSLLYIIGIVLLSIVIFLGTNKINSLLQNKRNIQKYLLFAVILIYIIFQIIWIVTVNPYIVADSIHVSNLAQTFYRGNEKEFLNNLTYAGIPLRQYIQSYPHQISLAFVYSIYFRLIHFDIIEFLRGFNVISNLLIIVAVYLIYKQLSKKYSNNINMLAVLMLTFISLPMLTTFVYGDIPSLAFCLFSVYFTMKYSQTNQVRYVAIASIFSMIAYMMRMNSLIFVIATVIYLILNLWKKTKKEKLLNCLIIILYIGISIIPTSIIQNHYFNKYNLDKDKKYPFVSYILMGMEESRRGNGWYNEEIAEPILKNPENLKGEYIQKIKNRLGYLSRHLGEAFSFYSMKEASMWTENTYSAVTNNCKEQPDNLEKWINPLTFYQKALLILTCFISIIVIIQNRKNLSLDLIFLITIFIGGFIFHTIWEAKSRYIIPYIVVLIPVAAIKIDKLFKIKEEKP